MARIFTFLFFLFTTTITFSQTQNKKVFVKHISASIIANGVMDEPIWESAGSATDFHQYFPSDSVPANKPTEIKMLFDDVNLYLGIKIYSAGKNYAIESLKRDYRAGNSDNITLMFDTFNDGTNAFMFGINPYGVRREGQVSGGGAGRGSFNISWDVKWKAESKIYEDYYISELVIPLTSFKFNEGETKWRFNAFKFDTQSNERTTWAHIPQNQPIINLAFMGDMLFDKPLGKSRTPLAIIPYLNTSSHKDFDTDQSQFNFKVGGDAKVAVGNSMNLDITINPDFSQVEVDNQITNLTRFEVGLPEKRQFFIDNSDLFGNFGGQRDANPFFSRRIGIAKDTAGNSIENRILGGVRLSGKVTKNWRLGFLTIQTEADEENEIASNNNTVFTLQKKMFSRSNIGMFFVNRQSFKDYDFLEEDEKYNRVIGVDYNLASYDNTWTGKFYTHKSFQPTSSGKDLSTGANLGYHTRNYNIVFDGVYIGEDFRSDLGFIRRTDIIKTVLGVERLFWPKKGIVNTHRLSFFPFYIWRPELDYKNTDYNLMTSYRAQFKDRSEFRAQMSNRYTFLTDTFDPTGKDGAIPLAANQGYHYTNYEMEYRSDQRKIFSYQLKPSVGKFFNGNRYSFEGRMNMRFQPKVFLSMIVNYDKIELPSPHSSADIWLISPKVDVTFSKSIFWSTLVQYSNQRDNLGFNSRLQWRFASLSDLFLVYNDNYYVNSFSPKFRSINLKLTYWLNI